MRLMPFTDQTSSRRPLCFFAPLAQLNVHRFRQWIVVNNQQVPNFPADSFYRPSRATHSPPNFVSQLANGKNINSKNNQLLDNLG